MRITRADVVTPANAVSSLGLLLTIYGAVHINQLGGVLLVTLGRTLDIVDGLVARRTHASQLGATIDATFDKLGVLAMIIQSIRHNVAPIWVLGTIAAFNTVNVLATIVARQKGIETKSSRDGKHAMFGHNITIAGYALAHVLGGNTVIGLLSLSIFILGLPSAIRASYGYVKQALQASALKG